MLSVAREPRHRDGSHRPRGWRRAVFTAAALAVAAPAWARHPLAIAVNIGASQAARAGTAKDFGLSASYALTQAFAVRAGYESITSFEMTVFSLAGTGRLPLGGHWALVGLIGGAHTSESPTGRPAAHSVNLLAGAGLAYRFTTHLSSRLQYQWLGGGGHGQRLQSLLLSLRYHF